MEALLHQMCGRTWELTDPVLWKRQTETNLVVVPGPVEVDCSIYSSADHLTNDKEQVIFPLIWFVPTESRL